MPASVTADPSRRSPPARGATDQMTDRQLQDLYSQPSAGPVQTGRLTLDDVVMKFSGLFALVLVFAGIGWALAPSPVGPVIMLGGIAATWCSVSSSPSRRRSACR